MIETALKTTDFTSLDDDTNTELHERFIDLPSPYDHFEQFAVLARRAASMALAPEALLALARFRNDPGEPGAFLIKNCPIDANLPATPPHGDRPNDKQTFVSEAILVAIAQELGIPFAMADEKKGEVIHQVCPDRGKLMERSSAGSGVYFRFHTERSVPEVPPDFLALLALRSSADAFTFVADIRKACEHLPNRYLAILRQSLFRTCPGQTSAPVGSTPLWSKPRPILHGSMRYPQIRVDFNCLSCEGSIAAEAASSLELALQEVQVIISLRAGDMLLIDNRKAVHARSQFRASDTEQSRWLQRVYIASDFWARRQFIVGKRTLAPVACES